LPDVAERAQRLSSVLHVLYLMFNEGYAASFGMGLQRIDLSDEATRLTRPVHQLLPDDGEVAGLLALMLLTDARRLAVRSGVAGSAQGEGDQSHAPFAARSGRIFHRTRRNAGKPRRLARFAQGFLLVFLTDRLADTYRNGGSIQRVDTLSWHGAAE